MKLRDASARALATAVTFALLTSCSQGDPDSLRARDLPFMLGLSMTRPGAVAIATDLGIRFMRPTLSWKDVEPDIHVEGTTRADVTNAERVSEFLRTHDFHVFDERLHEMLDAGIEAIPIVGHGYATTMPSMGDVRAGPDVLGREEYLARQYLVTRATVERYDGDGIDDEPTHLRVRIWQTENELNQAFLAAMLGQRDPTRLDALSSLWRRWDFLTELLETLRKAVLDADPTALTTQNFHTDIHEDINRSFSLPAWRDAIRMWRDQMDIVSFDAYPNYYRATPLRASVLETRTREIRELAEGRPVMLLETGYASGPSELSFNEENQGAYMRDAFDAARRAGVAGFFWFGTRTSESSDVAITSDDLVAVENIARAFDDGDVATLSSYILESNDGGDHLASVIGSVESYAGLVRADGSPKPAYEILRSIATEIDDSDSP